MPASVDPADPSEAPARGFPMSALECERVSVLRGRGRGFLPARATALPGRAGDDKEGRRRGGARKAIYLVERGLCQHGLEELARPRLLGAREDALGLALL